MVIRLNTSDLRDVRPWARTHYGISCSSLAIGIFTAAGFLYVLSGGAIGFGMMIEAAFLPTWLPLVDQPLLLVVLFITFGRLDLNE